MTAPIRLFLRGMPFTNWYTFHDHFWYIFSWPATTSTKISLGAHHHWQQAVSGILFFEDYKKRKGKNASWEQHLVIGIHFPLFLSKDRRCAQAPNAAHLFIFLTIVFIIAVKISAFGSRCYSHPITRDISTNLLCISIWKPEWWDSYWLFYSERNLMAWLKSYS